MPIVSLKNLEKIGKLKLEKPNIIEINRMLSLANRRLQDASHASLSI